MPSAVNRCAHECLNDRLVAADGESVAFFEGVGALQQQQEQRGGRRLDVSVGLLAVVDVPVGRDAPREVGIGRDQPQAAGQRGERRPATRQEDAEELVDAVHRERGVELARHRESIVGRGAYVEQVLHGLEHHAAPRLARGARRTR